MHLLPVEGEFLHTSLRAWRRGVITTEEHFTNVSTYWELQFPDSVVDNIKEQQEAVQEAILADFNYEIEQRRSKEFDNSERQCKKPLLSRKESGQCKKPTSDWQCKQPLSSSDGQCKKPAHTSASDQEKCNNPSSQADSKWQCREPSTLTSDNLTTKVGPPMALTKSRISTPKPLAAHTAANREFPPYEVATF